MPLDVSSEVNHVYLMALEHARNAETIAAGSSLATVELSKIINVKNRIVTKTLEGRKFTRSDVPSLVEGILPNNELRSFARFVELAGASKYQLDHVPSRFDSVEFVDSYEFKHVSKNVETQTIMDGSSMLIVDGYIENVSEIHTILDYCGKNRQRLLICCRGCSDDVSHTLAVNRARGTLSAFALAFPFDENDANTLVDIAMLVGHDVISSLKGQLISAVEPDKLPQIQFARLIRDKLLLNDSRAHNRIVQHVKNIKEKLLSAQVESFAPLEKRLKRLSGSTMIVRLKSGVDHQLRCELWDQAFRTIKCATRGVIEVSDESKHMWPDRKLLPMMTVATAHEYAKKLIYCLDQLTLIEQEAY
jgi:hypothetical protein